MTEEQFFKQLQVKTKRVFEESDVYLKNKDKNWFYAICNGPIFRERPIVFGLNWGVHNTKNFKGHTPQSKYPKEINTNTWRFKTHVSFYLNRYFSYSFDEVNYSNLCFFRTPKAKFLCYKDWRDSISLFKEYVDYINPPYLIMMGTPKYFNDQELTEVKKIGILPKGKNRRSFVRIAVLFDKYKIGSVPHSSAHISPATHDALWNILYEKFK